MAKTRRKFITVAADEYSEWTCLCGNTAVDQGFYPCNHDGEQVEPTPEDWTTNWYVCNQCGRIIDQETSRVVGYRDDNTLSEDQQKAIIKQVEQYDLPDTTN